MLRLMQAEAYMAGLDDGAQLSPVRRSFATPSPVYAAVNVPQPQMAAAVQSISVMA